MPADGHASYLEATNMIMINEWKRTREVSDSMIRQKSVLTFIILLEMF